MKKITVRPAEPSDAHSFFEYTLASLDINLADADSLTAPTFTVLAADSEEGPEMYMPYQLTMTLDALAPKPGLDPRKEAICLKRLMEYAVDTCNKIGVSEINFMCCDKRVIEFAEAHGFEVLIHPVLRLKVKDFNGGAKRPRKGNDLENRIPNSEQGQPSS